MTNIINITDQNYSVKNCNRKYSMGDAGLAVYASNLAHTLSRNLADFTKYGVTQAKIDEMSSLVSEFFEFPGDDYFLGDVMMATAAKSAKEDEIIEAIREMALRVELKWGDDSPQYRRIGAKGINDLRNDKLIGKAKSVCQAMQEFLPELAELGMSELMIMDLDTMADEYEEAMNNQDKAMENRVINSEQRILKGNQIYQMVTYFCKIGRKIYRNKSLARYNEFVIYSQSASSIGTPENFSYNAAASTFVWDEVKNANTYQLESSADGTAYSEVYSGADNMVYLIPTNIGTTYYRVRAKNGGGAGAYTKPLAVEFAGESPTAQ